MIKTKAWIVGVTAGALLCVLLLAVSINQVKGILGEDKNNSVNTITVAGKGEAISIPDIATFSFSVTETANTVKQAQDMSAEKLNRALKAIRGYNIADKDIKTTNYSINPHYEYTQAICTANGSCPPGKSVLTGYEVSQTIEVKVRDLSKAGAIFDSVGALGVQNVNGLSFSIDNIDSVKEKARTDAINDAKSRAQKLASELGVHLVQIVNFSDDNVSPYPMAYGVDSMMSQKASAPRVAPEIPAGEQKITSNVSITYEIR